MSYIYPRVFTCPICGNKGNGLCLKASCIDALKAQSAIKRSIPDADLLNTLERINRNHGRGKVIAYTLDPDDGSGQAAGYATRRIPVTQTTGSYEYRRFRVVGSTVHFLRHQMKLGAK